MRIETLKFKISEEVKAFESGKLQVFCQNFLPLFSPIYEGLTRFGGTADGKTRKGTPDLIKTLKNGEQIAVECSVLKNYWKILKDYNKWKPCEDIDKCIEKVEKLQEIVLFSNQEIPTNCPNAESKIIEYAIGKTSAKITLFHLARIEDVLSEKLTQPNPKLSDFLKTYLPCCFEDLKKTMKIIQSDLTVELYKKSHVPFDVLNDMATEVFNETFDPEQAKKCLEQKIGELTSRFESSELPTFKCIRRNIPKDFQFLTPAGSIKSLIGVPKIGKTFLISQCGEKWKENNYTIHCFYCPIDERDNHLFIEDFLRNIFSLFMAPNNASELVAGRINLESLDFEEVKYNLANPSIYVIDNAEVLSETDLRRINAYLSCIKKIPDFSQIGIIFISNKRLEPICPVINEEIVALFWDESEIRELLLFKNFNDENRLSSEYIKILRTMSNGHPLIALALTKENPTIRQLLESTLKAPSNVDSDLTKEIKYFLFQDILGDDSDALKFVLRMSVLATKAKDKIINTIMKIEPAIDKPLKLIFDKILGPVVEGDNEQGYAVADIYKNIAKEKIDSSQQQKIYEALSDELLTLKDKILDGEDTIEGIYYAILAKNFQKAFSWANILLHSVPNNKTQLEAVLARISFIAFIEPPLESKVLFLYYSVLLQIAVKYTYIDQNDMAINLLDNVESSLGGIEDEIDKSNLSNITELVKFYKAFLYAQKNPERSLEVVSEINLEKLSKNIPLANIQALLLDLVDNLILTLPLSSIPKTFVSPIINKVDLSNEKILSSLINISSSLGFKAKQEGISVKDVNTMLNSEKTISDLLKLICEAAYNLQQRFYDTVIQKVNQCFAWCEEKHIKYKSIETALRNIEGDTYYSLDKELEAQKSYLKMIECIGDDTESFKYAWANYRMGLLSDDPEKAKEYFNISSEIFGKIGYDECYSRCQGEKAIAFFQVGKFIEFIQIAEDICSGYYLNGKQLFGPSCALILAHLTRFRLETEKKSISEEQEMIFPELARGSYERILDIVKPQAGGLTAFFTIAKCYSLLGIKKKMLESLRTSLSFEPHTSIDEKSLLLVIHELLNEITPGGDKEEIKNLILKGISIDVTQMELLPGIDSKGYISFTIFSKVDNVIVNTNATQKLEFIAMLDEIQQRIKDSSHKDKGWWSAEICLRKARIAENYYQEKGEKFKLWRETFELGNRYSNIDSIIESGHQLGFVYCEYSKSIRDLIEKQFSIIKVFSQNTREPERLETIGKNLFKLWDGLDYCRISAEDIEMKNIMKDGVKSLNNAEISGENAAPIMILLLSSIYSYKGFATEWAVAKIKENKIESQIPSKIKEKINVYF